jgi:dTDP-4-amino-4,6-dideoxygalactose transaminase
MARRIPRYNYSAQFEPGLPALMAALERMLVEGRYVLSEEVREFEQAWGRYLDVPYVRGVNSGTDAIALALMALDLRPGDEVVTQANTFNASVAAICLAGATPVLVDANEDTFLMDDRGIVDVITPRTRVLMPVHLFGKPTPMSRILALAATHGLAVVEDAAQAHGARIEGRRVGGIGTLGCFSFHPSKNLAAAGDGGAVFTRDAGLAEAVGRRRELGQQGQNHHVVLGMNSKLDAIQARILLHKLPQLDQWNDGRRRVAGWYRERLAGLPVRLQGLEPSEEHVFHLFQIRTDRRDELIAHLRGNAIDATIRYPTPIHLQPAFSNHGWRKGQFPVAERLADELLCLPIRPDMSLDEVEWVTDCVRAFFGPAGT